MDGDRQQASESGKKQVFVSYHSEDLDFVQQLERQLANKLPIDLIYDRVLPAGASFAKTLISGISRSDITLALLSPSYLNSPWAAQELKIAIERSLDGDTTLIPVILKPCDPRGYVSLLKPIDFTKNQDEALTELIWGITGERPMAATGDSPGRPTNEIDPAELAAVRTENRGFEKSPDRREEDATSSQSTKVRCCFVIMPFNDPNLDHIYKTVIVPAASAHGVCERGDDAFGSNVIMDDVLSKIRSCTFAIADLTGRNSNVLYELGICHAIGKPVLLLAQSVEDLPFDLRHRRVVIYQNTPLGVDKLEVQIKQNLQAMVSHGK
jgi:TIR domain